MRNIESTPYDREWKSADPNSVGFAKNAPALDKRAVATLERIAAMTPAERLAAYGPKNDKPFQW